jgi:hypothetical protein
MDCCTVLAIIHYSKFKQLETYNTTLLWNVKTFLQHLASAQAH